MLKLAHEKVFACEREGSGFSSCLHWEQKKYPSSFIDENKNVAYLLLRGWQRSYFIWQTYELFFLSICQTTAADGNYVPAAGSGSVSCVDLSLFSPCKNQATLSNSSRCLGIKQHLSASYPFIQLQAIFKEWLSFKVIEEFLILEGKTFTRITNSEKMKKCEQ